MNLALQPSVNLALPKIFVAEQCVHRTPLHLDGSSSFRVSNLGLFFYDSILKGVTNFSNTLRSNLSGFCFRIFFNLINFLFISTLVLTIL